MSLADIVIATPGRLVNHITLTKGFDLTNLRFMVSVSYINTTYPHIGVLHYTTSHTTTHIGVHPNTTSQQRGTGLEP